MDFKAQIPLLVFFHQFLQLIIHFADSYFTGDANAILLIRIIVALCAFLNLHFFDHHLLL
jgi:hypothetical protein